jgi:uncharacterized protein (DUF2147 family)
LQRPDGGGGGQTVIVHARRLLHCHQIAKPETCPMKFFLIAAAAAVSVIASPALAAAPVTGKWITAEKDSVIEIGTCSGTVCGKVLKIMRMMADGKMPIDRNNPDTALRARPIEGMVILTGFTDNGKNWKGRIYDPKSGKSYTSYLTRNANGTLKVQGCVGPFCQAFTWTAAK